MISGESQVNRSLSPFFPHIIDDKNQNALMNEWRKGENRIKDRKRQTSICNFSMSSSMIVIDLVSGLDVGIEIPGRINEGIFVILFYSVEKK